MDAEALRAARRPAEAPPKPVVVIECDPDLYAEIVGCLQNSIAGKTIFYGDSLGDIVRRHCPDVFEMAVRRGFRFVPNPESAWLEQIPVQIWFDIVREGGMN